MTENGLLKMKELAEASGVSAGTIKHYLREGLLPEPVDDIALPVDEAALPVDEAAAAGSCPPAVEELVRRPSFTLDSGT